VDVLGLLSSDIERTVPSIKFRNLQDLLIRNTPWSYISRIAFTRRLSHMTGHYSCLTKTSPPQGGSRSSLGEKTPESRSLMSETVDHSSVGLARD
jgi:hypothetical protein